MIGQSCIRGRGQSGASATGCLQIKKLGGRESAGKWAADSPAKGSIFTSVSRAERKVTPAVQQVWGKQRAPRRGRAAFIILTSTGNPTQPTSPTPTPTTFDPPHRKHPQSSTPHQPDQHSDRPLRARGQIFATIPTRLDATTSSVLCCLIYNPIASSSSRVHPPPSTSTAARDHHHCRAKPQLPASQRSTGTVQAIENLAKQPLKALRRIIPPKCLERRGYSSLRC